MCLRAREIKPAYFGRIKTCGAKKCTSELLSQSIRKARLGTHWDIGFKKRQSKRIKLAYKQGRMKHMKKVWSNGSKLWKSSANPRWKPLGSKRKNHNYILIKYREHCGFGNWMQEHRFIMEKYLHRKLKKSEVIHHINHNKADNRLSNLKLMHLSEHKKHHLKDNLFKR